MRETPFVEIGPVTAFARRTFSALLPFPALRMGWGLDAHWAALAREHGWRCGVLDAVSIRHRAAPAASAYSREAALAEARAFLAERPYLPAREIAAHPRHPPALVMSARQHSGAPKVAVVAEFYPSQGDPVLGVWAHRQALAARDAGAEVRVLVLHRLVPPRASLRGRTGRRRERARQSSCASRASRRTTASRSPTSPTSRRRARAPTRAGERGPRPRSALALRRLRRSFAFDLIHAHNAVPAGEAVRRALAALRLRDVPLVVSVHGGDVLYTAAAAPTGSAAGAAAVARGLGAARLVLANSQGIAELARAHGAGETRVVHLGADLPARPYSSRRTESPARGSRNARRSAAVRPS